MRGCSIFRKFTLIWLIGEVLEAATGAPHEVHRIILKTHLRRARDRDHQHPHKHHSVQRQTRRPPLPDSSYSDEWNTSPTKSPRHHYNINENGEGSGQKHGKLKSHHTTMRQPSDSEETMLLTTTYPEKLPVAVPESYYRNYYFPGTNNTIDFNAFSAGNSLNSVSYNAKYRQLREKEPLSPKNRTQPSYEVYEEIIGDTSPPTFSTLKLRTSVQKPTLLNTPLPILNTIPTASTAALVTSTSKHEEDLGENSSERSPQSTKTYGKKTRQQRNRGSTRYA